MRIESNGASSSVGLEPVTSDAVASTAPAGTSEVARELASDRAEVAPSGASSVWRSSAASGPAALAPPAMLREMAHAIATDGIAGFDNYIESHPAEARALAESDRESTETTLRELIGEEIGGPRGAIEGYWQADAALDRFEEALGAEVRETVRSVATMAIDEQITAIERSTPEEALEAIRSAPPGSPLAAMGERIGLRGDDMDLTRLRHARSDAHESLVELRDTIAGQTWSPEELPGTARRVMAEMGLADAPDGSMAAAAFHRPALDAATAAHRAEVYADATFTGIEVGHGLHVAGHALHAVAEAGAAGAGMGVAATEAAWAIGTTVALPAALCVGGIAFGVAIHHQIEENRMERTEVARHFGL